jgi:SWIM/SEC-C metal-binding protein
MQVIAFCRENGIHCIAGVEPDQSEDVSDIDRALTPPTPALVEAKVGRNEPCPCDSGKKYKKCCAGAAASSP